MITIIILAIIQSVYDFAGWFGIFKENDKHPTKNVFRWIKVILDFIVVPAIAFLYFGVSLGVLAAFFVAKWFHLCDSFYNIYRYILKNEPTTDWGYWRWWTPLGLLRTNFWGVCVLPGKTEWDFAGQVGYWHPNPEEGYVGGLFYKQIGFKRGMVSITEAWIQTAIGLLLAGLLLLVVG